MTVTPTTDVKKDSPSPFITKTKIVVSVIAAIVVGLYVTFQQLGIIK